MALITISGYPCSGKSTRAQQIKSYLDGRLQDPAHSGRHCKVVILSDDSLGGRDVYDDSHAEKNHRAALFTAIQRQVAKDTLLIVDSMNYIKGFRYQMFCAAKELRVCTIYVLATPELCRQRNSERSNDLAYAPETLENLLLRFEEPSSMVRWDKPLFSVLWDSDIPGPAIWDAITVGKIISPNSGTLNTAKTPPGALHTVEKITTTIVLAIYAEIVASQGTGGAIAVPLPSGGTREIKLPARTLTLAELERLKRQFVSSRQKATSQGTTERGALAWDAAKIVEIFVKYLEETLYTS